ncbi:SNF2 family N-terminal domain-domain-containing protein [Leucosporidium creatinivorum]|uniref:SNF2 family N-terminal domain-domain-containing protein n=1 Tax=Leucosporidium creatinivorum TaxID=106004 RepID=A0A1Y2G826_9BASI|nr:SNF2 family N-terminal domain-domain-containing protein [Leucosporidium creatinivorum]
MDSQDACGAEESMPTAAARATRADGAEARRAKSEVQDKMDKKGKSLSERKGKSNSRAREDANEERLSSSPRRFITPAPEAAASLPTPHPQSPLAGQPDHSELSQRLPTPRATSPSPEKSSRISNDSYGLPTPATPLSPAASAANLPLPRPPQSPNKPARTPIPLKRLIPAGTLLLRNHSVLPGAAVDSAEDGWKKLAKGILERQQPPAEEVAEEAEQELVIANPEPASPAKAKSRGKGKRKAANGGRASPAKKRKTFDASEGLLETLIHLQDALLLRATFIAVKETIVLRLYLIPADLEELEQVEFVRGRRARPADSVVVGVLSAVRIDEEEWKGVVGHETRPSLMEEQDKRSILELYRAVPSPPIDPNSVDSLDNASPLAKDRIANALESNPAGFLTELYPYQKASLAKMLQRELAPESAIDASFLLRTNAIDSSTFYVSVRGEVRREPPREVEPRSGILAEDMGSGKTCICLALVLSTLRELPRLEGTPTYLDGSPGSPNPVLMTHLSRNFPFEKEMQEEKSLRPRVLPPILKAEEMDAVEWEAYERALARQEAEDARQVRPPLPSLRTLMIDCVRTSPVPIFYSNDDPLLGGLVEQLGDCNPYYNLRPSPAQMTSRQGRHGGAQPSQIYVSTATLIVVPTDLVRQWQDELAKHVEKGALRVLVLRTKKNGFVTAQQLASYDLVLMSIARFGDAAGDPHSPLRRVHWRRLMVDEGHTLSSANRTRLLAEELRVDSRWAISGTPSTNLRSATAENEGALFAHDSTVGGSEVDYDRVGQLFSRFLQHPSFPKTENWRQVITDPILKHGRGAERLGRIFNSAIIRNSPERVKEAYQLPPLTRSVVNIDLGETERKTYNALIAVFKTNSVLSQRKDQDYLFAPRNKKYLDELTDNLAASSFFFASSGSNGIHARLLGAIKYAEETLDSEKSLKWSDEDRQGLRKAMSVMQEALDDPEWASVNGSVSVNLDVRGLDDELIGVFGGLSASKNARGRTLVPLDDLVTLRVDLKELRKPDIGVWKDDDDLREELITFEARRKREAAIPPKNKAIVDTETKPVKKKRKKGELEVLLPLPADSLFHQIQLGSSTSAKLNWVVKAVREYPEDKFIVFSSSLPDLVFANLSEAFDLLGIRHVIFASHGKNRDRGAVAARFNSTSAQECQVILVDARLGGRGFCLTAASRVIMLEPIWQPDLEVQAAKRAHRLGQSKPVHLSVLVVPGSYEDALLKRRADLNPLDFAKTKQPQRDSKLSDLLQSAMYLEPSTQPIEALERVPLITEDLAPPSPDELPLPPLPPLPPLRNSKVAALPTPMVQTHAAGQSNEEGEPPKKKKKKSVKFAEPE